ncbi:transposable element Tcb1 transposase [Trichonephila clavipes]|nr:transposable element Tcb1 transposase [Trichonephila clavipes]
MQITGNHQMARIVRHNNQSPVSEELESLRVSSPGFGQRFQDDGNVSTCYSTGLPRVTTPNEGSVYIWQLLPKEKQTEHKASDLSRQLSSATGIIVLQGRVHWSVCMFVNLSDEFHLTQLTVACN